MISKKFGFWLLLLLVFGCTSRPTETTPSIFDEKADARRDIAAAISKAEVSKNNIVLVFGANW